MLPTITVNEYEQKYYEFHMNAEKRINGNEKLVSKI